MKKPNGQLGPTTFNVSRGAISKNFAVDLNDKQLATVADMMKSHGNDFTRTNSPRMKRIIGIVLLGSADNTSAEKVVIDRGCRVFLGYRVASDANLAERL